MTQNNGSIVKKAPTVFITWWFLMVVVIVVFAMYVILNKMLPNEKTWFNITSLVSSVIGIIGFIIAIQQIQTVKDIAKHTEFEVKSAFINYTKILLAQEITQKLMLINEIERYLAEDRFDLCHMRMKDLLAVLNQIKATTSAIDYEINQRILSKLTRGHNIDCQAIYMRIINSRNNINKELIIKNIMDVNNFLSEIRTDLTLK